MKFYNSFLILFIIFSSCQRNSLDIDASDIELDIVFFDVNKIFKNLDLAQTDSIHRELKQKFGEIYLFEVEMNLQLPASDSMFSFALNKFYNNEYIQSIQSAVEELEEEIELQELLATKAFQRLKFHFPSYVPPKYVIYINKLFSEIQVGDSVLSIGLENYIGASHDLLKNIPNDQLHQWQKERMEPKFIARDMALKWIQVNLFEEIEENLIRHIIQAGKVLYCLKAAFPNETDAFVLRYNKEQFSIAEENEKHFWNYLIKENLLFQNNLREKNNFLNEGPYTIGLPEKVPDRMGQFLGFQMVKNYVKKHKALSLPELLNIDYNEILQAYEI
ncbi:MAG: hypothetical protein JJT77_11510 [Crocinitomicaceae bacterium]|nr:hypothetical protein [Crocinitomicaceae bacterium]